MSNAFRRCALSLLASCIVTTAAAQELAPNALLSIDQHRPTIIDRIVTDWGDALSQGNAGIDKSQLRVLLQAMRADHLLSASLAGSLDGLRGVIEDAVTSKQAGKPVAKALGDITQDIVYTPVTPCRLVETRGVFAAVYQGDGSAAHTAVPFSAGEVRNYAVQGGNAACLSQLPAGLNPSAVQLQVFGIPTGGGSGDIEILPQGSTFGSTATLVFLGNVAFTSASTTARVNTATNQIGVQVRQSVANVAIDVVGFFAPPVATALQCTTVSSASAGIAVSSDTLVALPSCATGYVRTGGSCSGTNGIPGAYLLENNATGCLFRNLSAVSPYNATATSTCCRVPGK